MEQKKEWCKHVNVSNIQVKAIFPLKISVDTSTPFPIQGQLGARIHIYSNLMNIAYYNF